MVDRTRARLDVRQLRTPFGMTRRPGGTGNVDRLEVVLETSVYDRMVFKLHFGKLTVKTYTRLEHVLRFEVVVDNTQGLGCGRPMPCAPTLNISTCSCAPPRFS
jgi:hypothetical protein